MSVSYWLDASEERSPIRADVVVIGAGIAGASIAYWLAKSGVDVALVDRGAVASGASGRNAGFVTCGSVEHYSRQVARHGEAVAHELWAMAEDNLRLIRDELVAGGVECGFRQRGTYSLAGTEHELVELQQSAKLMADKGIRVSMVTEADVARDLGARGFTGGALYHDDGEVHPVQLVRGIAEKSGARVFPHSEVHRIEVPNASEVVVHAAEQRFEASALVLATNGYSHLLDPYFRERIFPTRGQIIVTEPVAPFLDAPCYANFVLDYFRQLDDGRVLIGGFRQLAKETEVGVADEPNEDIHAALEAFLARHFECLEGVRLTHRWAGIMGFSVDGTPMIGSLPGRPNAYFCAGFTAHGIGMGFRAGQLTADLMLEGKSPGALSARRPTLA